MARMSELDITIKAIREAAESLNAAADGLVLLFSDNIKKQPESEPTPKVKTVTFDDVRKVLSVKAADGKREDVKALLAKYGATKLSDITDSDTLTALMKDAEVL